MQTDTAYPERWELPTERSAKYSGLVEPSRQYTQLPEAHRSDSVAIKHRRFNLKEPVVTSASLEDQGELPADEFIVDEIIGKQAESGHLEHLVKWDGHDVNESTWEPIENLSTAGLAIKQFEEARLSTPKIKLRSTVPVSLGKHTVNRNSNEKRNNKSPRNSRKAERNDKAEHSDNISKGFRDKDGKSKGTNLKAGKKTKNITLNNPSNISKVLSPENKSANQQGSTNHNPSALTLNERTASLSQDNFGTGSQQKDKSDSDPGKTNDNGQSNRLPTTDRPHDRDVDNGPSKKQKKGDDNDEGSDYLKGSDQLKIDYTDLPPFGHFFWDKPEKVSAIEYNPKTKDLDVFIHWNIRPGGLKPYPTCISRADVLRHDPLLLVYYYEKGLTFGNQTGGGPHNLVKLDEQSAAKNGD